MRLPADPRCFTSRHRKKRDKRSFAGCRYLLNAILDQFVDCKFIIHYYTQFTVHKMVQNYFSYHISLKSGGILHPPTIMGTAVFTENHDLITVPLVAKIGKRSNGRLHWDAVEAWCNNFDQI